MVIYIRGLSLGHLDDESYIFARVSKVEKVHYVNVHKKRYFLTHIGVPLKVLIDEPE